MTRTDRSHGAPAYCPSEMWKRDTSPAARRQALETRRDEFDRLNRMCVGSGNAWLTSIPGDPECRMEATADSIIPAQLEQLGYRLEDDGIGQRIINGAIVEEIGTGSRRQVRTYAGPVAVRRFTFLM